MTDTGKHVLEDFEYPEVTDDDLVRAANAILFSYDELEGTGGRP